MSAESIRLKNLIQEGFRLSNKKLIEACAAKNEVMIVSDNGKVKHIPAKELLTQINAAK